MAIEVYKIFDNIAWTSNQPLIYLTLQYDVDKDSIGNHRNRDSAKKTYTMYNTKLTVSMPGKYAYYGYTVGAQILSSGTPLTPQVQLKASQPQYWKEYSYNFGDVVINGVSFDQESFPVTLRMISNAPMKTYSTRKYLTEAAYEIFSTEMYKVFESPDPDIPFGVDIYTLFAKEYERYLIGNQETEFTPGYYTSSKFIGSSTTTHTEKEDRNALYTKDVYIGKGYILPTISITVTEIGSNFIGFVAQYSETVQNSANNPEWKWKIVCNSQTQETDTNVSSFVGKFDSLILGETYTMAAKFGSNFDSGQEGEDFVSCSLELPSRCGFYVYDNDKWNYSVPQIFVGNNVTGKPSKVRFFIGQNYPIGIDYNVRITASSTDE